MSSQKTVKDKGKGLLDYRAYGSGADPGSWQSPASDVSHKPGGRLPLLSARPAVTLATATLIAKFHYTDTTGPDQTRVSDNVRGLCLVGSGRIVSV